MAKEKLFAFNKIIAVVSYLSPVNEAENIFARQEGFHHLCMSLNPAMQGFDNSAVGS
jgi:hypothetical protein